MTKNPFDKTDFPCYREWEGALIDFLIKQLSHFDSKEWVDFATNEKCRVNAAFCALLLSNLSNNSEGDDPNAVYDLLKKDGASDGNRLNDEAVQYGEWLRSGWLNIPRVADAIKLVAKAKMNLSPSQPDCQKPPFWSSYRS